MVEFLSALCLSDRNILPVYKYPNALVLNACMHKSSPDTTLMGDSVCGIPGIQVLHLVLFGIRVPYTAPFSSASAVPPCYIDCLIIIIVYIANWEAIESPVTALPHCVHTRAS